MWTSTSRANGKCATRDRHAANGKINACARSRSSATNRLITAKDHASVQIDIARVDEQGIITGETDTLAICGFVRRKGLSDEAFYRLAKKLGYKTFE